MMDWEVRALADITHAVVRRSWFGVRRSRFVVRRSTFVVRREDVRCGHGRPPAQRAYPRLVEPRFLAVDAFCLRGFQPLAAGAPIRRGEPRNRPMEASTVFGRQLIQQLPVGRAPFEHVGRAA